MALTTAVLGIVLVVGLALSTGFGVYCINRRETRGARSLTVLFVGLFFWILADLVQLLTPADPMPIVGLPFRFLGPDIGVVGVFLFGLEYTGRERFLDRRVLAVLALKPVLTQALLFSPYRETIALWSGERIPTVGYDLVMTPLFASHTLYSWAVMLTGVALLGYMMLQADEVYQLQIVAVLFAILFPFTFNVLARTGTVPFDLTGPSFLVTAGLFAVAAFRLRLMDTIPIAQRLVLEEMQDMVVVLDETGSLIFVNEAVYDRFGVDTDILGADLTDLFGADASDSIAEDFEEVQVIIDGETRYLSVDSSTIRDYRGTLLAQVLVCRDVTDQKRREEALRRREEDLRLLKDLQSRFLRHNLRNELNVVQMNAESITNRDDPEQVALYETVMEKTDQILDWGTKARTIEQLIEMEETVRCDPNQQITEIHRKMQQLHPGVRFELDLAEECWIDAVPQVQQAIENVVDNAARYNTAGEPVVRISTAVEGDEAIVTVSDNGPGIDEGELLAIREGGENKLEHSSGLGLWLVYWVVEKSGGTVSFQVDDGTRVQLTFDRADEPEPDSA